MPDIDYLKIFRDAWKITWKNRFLWWFGFFMLLTGISSPNYFQKGADDSSTKWQELTDKINFQEFIDTHTKLLIAIGAILFVLFIISFFLSVISRGALMKSIQRILKNETVNFKSGWKDGSNYFWNNFKLIFFSGLAFIFCLIILIIPVIILFTIKAYAIAIPLAILAIIIIIPLIVIYKYVQTYASIYITLADLKPWLAAENAYALFKKNVLASIIMSLLFIPIGFASFLAIFAIFIIFVFVFGLLGITLYLILNKVGAFIAIITAIILFILTAIAFYSVFITFSQVAWVLFFYKIATPKISRTEEESVKETALENTAIVEGIKTSETKD